MKATVLFLLLTAGTVFAQTPITLTYSDPDARSVAVAGEFTGGMPQPMTRDATGKWTKTVFLRNGAYGYRFLVNGSKWITDPGNPALKKVGTTDYSVLNVGAPTAVEAAPTPAGPVTLGDLVIEPTRPQVFEIPVSETAWKKAASLPRPDCDNSLPSKPTTATVKVGLCVPAGFNPARSYPMFVVSSTLNWPCVEHSHIYARHAAEVGWVTLAADAPEVPKQQRDDSNAYRWAMIGTALEHLHKHWPASRNWPVAAGGFSGGGARSGYVGALLMKSNYRVIGMWLGGINADVPSWGLRLYGPSSSPYMKVPIYFSYGTRDTVCKPEWAAQGLADIKRAGYKRVRSATYDGGHDPYADHIKAGLEWFVAESKN